MGKFTKRIVLLFFCLLIPALVYSDVIPSKKVLVVYYSRTGHTQLVAQELSKKFNADLERLIDRKKRIGPLMVIVAAKDAVTGNSTQIDPLKLNPKDYDTILIGSPAWNGHITPAIRTFIKQNDLSGKKIGLFALCHLVGAEDAIKEAFGVISGDKNKNFPALALKEGELKSEVLNAKIDTFYKAMQ
jgi:flavodoxin